jgi:ubiquinone/menaquinone biosynthesis C-methylase UbiE
MLEVTAASEDDHFWFRHLRRTAKSLLSAALAGIQPRLIIDCGAGTGRNLEWLSGFGPAVGIERSPTGLAFGRKQGRRLLQGSVTHLPFADNAADVVTSFDVLYCLDDLEERQAVREMFRVLAFDGVAVVNAAALDILHGSHSALTHEQRRYTRRRLVDRLEDEGFSVERVTYTNMMTFPLALAVRMSERLTGRAGTASDADLRVPAAAVNSALNTMLAVEHAWLRFANLPVGSSVMAVARKRRG